MLVRGLWGVFREWVRTLPTIPYIIMSLLGGITSGRECKGRTFGAGASPDGQLAGRSLDPTKLGGLPLGAGIPTYIVSSYSF